MRTVDCDRLGSFVVETAEGEFRFVEFRYAATRFKDDASPWARLYWEQWPGEFGPATLLAHRGKKPSVERNG